MVWPHCQAIFFEKKRAGWKSSRPAGLRFVDGVNHCQRVLAWTPNSTIDGKRLIGLVRFPCCPQRNR